MENLFGTIGQSDIKDLLATGDSRPVAVNLEPGSGVIPYGTLIYRKSSGLYAPAAAAQISASYNLLVLKDNVDVSTSAAVAVAAAAYESGCFKAGCVKKADGNGDYEDISAAEAIVLREFGIVFAPFDNWAADDVEVDNRVALAVTVTAGSNGSASADKQTAKKGEKVKLTITPASTYVMDEIKVTAGDVEIQYNTTDGYHFIQGEKAVTVTVSFKSES